MMGISYLHDKKKVKWIWMKNAMTGDKCVKYIKCGSLVLDLLKYS